MQATITYQISEQAQREQMAATGQPVARRQQHVIDIAPEDLRFVNVAMDGSLSKEVDYSKVNGSISSIPAVGSAATPEEAWSLYKVGQLAAEEKVNRAKEEEKRKAVESLAATVAADASAAAWIDELPGKLGGYADARSDAMRAAGVSTPNWNAKLPLLDAAIARLGERNSAAVAQKKAEDEAKERAKTAYIADWISQHGDQLIRDQFAAGALCRAKALSMIAAAAFSAAGVSEEDHPRICEDHECACGQEAVSCIPTEAFAVLQQIKQALPAESAVKFKKVRECLRDHGYAEEGEDAAPPYYAALIAIPVGPFTFERQVRLRGPESRSASGEA